MPNVWIRSLVAVGVASALALGCADGVVSQYRSAHPGCAGSVTLTHRPGTQVFDAVGCGSRATVHRECTVGAAAALARSGAGGRRELLGALGLAVADDLVEDAGVRVFGLHFEAGDG